MADHARRAAKKSKKKQAVLTSGYVHILICVERKRLGKDGYTTSCVPYAGIVARTENSNVIVEVNGKVLRIVADAHGLASIECVGVRVDNGPAARASAMKLSPYGWLCGCFAHEIFKELCMRAFVHELLHTRALYQSVCPMYQSVHSEFLPDSKNLPGFFIVPQEG